MRRLYPLDAAFKPYTLPPIALPDGFAQRCAKAVYDLTAEWDRELCNVEAGTILWTGDYGLWCQVGPLEEHRDGAGETYGIAVVATGNPVLVVGEERFPLVAGTLFHFDSDDYHALESDDADSVLLFIVRDFGIREPDTSLAEFGPKAVAAIDGQIAKLEHTQ